jgi:deferrochelatase/peroxidase EfeB
LRRGRTYYRSAKDGQQAEKGLLFVALCSDLERQYEFVQQTWLNSPNFHGLSHEPDPLVTPDQGRGKRVFTIPTAAGTITLENMQSFITVRGGGYFFLPSRSSLRFLIDLISNP